MTAGKLQPRVATDNADADFSVYDHPLLRREYLLPSTGPGPADDNNQRSVIQLDNIRCAACCAAIERAVNAMDGVRHAEINYNSHQLRVGWDEQRTSLGAVIQLLNQLGYPAQPVSVDAHRRGPSAIVAAQRNRLTRQLGVAAALGMQVMVLSVCLYAGAWWGIDTAIERFFSALSALLTLPLLIYSGQSFLLGAFGDLRRVRIGMDVPVALGLCIAFLASLQAVYSGGGETYFDSICMFVVLVLAARLIEVNCRLRAMSAVNRFDTVLPLSARRLADDRTERVPLGALAPGDRILLDAGEVVPADGSIVTGLSSFDESLLSGESMPVQKQQGDPVVAGALNVLHPVTIELTRVGTQTRFSAIARLVRQARFAKPLPCPLVDRLARWFVLAVLCIAAVVALHGWLVDSVNALPATIAVLIVSCPCALALATPAALAVAMNRALTQGMMVSNPATLETLAKADHFFFDKTGTLTTGDFIVKTIEPTAHCHREQLMLLARSLERYSAHPVATAFHNLGGDSRLNVTDIDTTGNAGISGTIDRQRYHMGSMAYVQAHTGCTIENQPGHGDSIVVLADRDKVLGVFHCADEIRPAAALLIGSLQARGKRVVILSGDRPEAVARVAAELGVKHFFAACTPEQKLRHVKRAVTDGAITAVLGDGVNDAPVISAAHVSIALADRVNLTATHADIVALNSNLKSVAALLSIAQRLTTTIRQNLGWALGYNALAIPFAAAGWVPPWLAAIGMSASSLVVVLNATWPGRRDISSQLPSG